MNLDGEILHEIVDGAGCLWFSDSQKKTCLFTEFQSTLLCYFMVNNARLGMGVQLKIHRI